MGGLLGADSILEHCETFPCIEFAWRAGYNVVSLFSGKVVGPGILVYPPDPGDA